MSFTQSQLDALNEAIASGTLRVTYDGRTIEYRSMDDLLRARGLVAASVNGSAGTARATHINPAFDRGA